MNKTHVVIHLNIEYLYFENYAINALQMTAKTAFDYFGSRAAE